MRREVVVSFVVESVDVLGARVVITSLVVVVLFKVVMERPGRIVVALVVEGTGSVVRTSKLLPTGGDVIPVPGPPTTARCSTCAASLRPWAARAPSRQAAVEGRDE